MNLKDILDKLEGALVKLTTDKPSETVAKLAESFPLKDDETIIVTFEPALEVGAIAMINELPAPAGDIVLVDGRTVAVDEAGIVLSIKEVQAEETTQEFSAENEFASLRKEFAELKESLKLSLEANISLSKEIELVKKMPASTPIEKPNYLKSNLELLKQK